MRGHSGSGYGLRASLALVSAVALVMGMTGGNIVVSAQTVPPKISYELDVYTGLDGPMCVGDTTGFLVKIIRGTTVNGRTYTQWIGGGRVLGEVADKHVADFTHYEVVDVSGAPTLYARFTFFAKSPGSTDVDFSIFKTGEESRVGNDPAFYSHHVGLNVEVVNCFDAYTSGLATVFDDPDMRGLDEPFLLTGHIASSTIAGSTQFMYFIPNPQNRTTGGYAFVDNAWAVADPRARCIAYVSGRYDVVFYPDEEHVVEGDLLMSGSGVAVCTDTTVPIDYQNTPGFHIGFKPRPTTP